MITSYFIHETVYSSAKLQINIDKYTMLYKVFMLFLLTLHHEKKIYEEDYNIHNVDASPRVFLQ